MATNVKIYSMADDSSLRISVRAPEWPVKKIIYTFWTKTSCGGAQNSAACRWTLAWWCFHFLEVRRAIHRPLTNGNNNCFVYAQEWLCLNRWVFLERRELVSAGRLTPLSIRHVVATPLIVLNLNKSCENNGFMALVSLWILLAAKPDII